jgi:hypothetical protein
MRRSPTAIVLLLVLSVAALSAQRPATADDRAAMLQSIDARREHYASVAKEIWGFAEGAETAERAENFSGVRL